MTPMAEAFEEERRRARDKANGHPPSGKARRAEPASDVPPHEPDRSPRIGQTLDASIVRIERRCSGVEKPIELPWPTLAPHFGGGLWPGLHILNAGTGVGKTQFALQAGSRAAKDGIPVLYVGLELGELDLALRMLGEEAHVPWSPLWTGKAGAAHVDRVRGAIPALRDLPFHYEVSRPHGMPPSALVACAERMRANYPEPDGPGSRPLLVVVDFLQLVGAELGSEQEMRIRIGRASYVLRDIANRLGMAVLCISSVARERYKTLSEIHTNAGLAWQTDPDGCPIDRRVQNVDAIVGMGKESGDIEYSADSVTVLARVGETWDGKGCDAIVVTAKGRATGATWSPLHFTGFRYEECPDRGGRVVEAWSDAGQRRDRVREEAQQARDAAKDEQVRRDAEAIRAYVAKNPGCTVRAARIVAVGDQPRRWTPAIALLGDDLVFTSLGRSFSLTLRHGATS